MGNANVIFSIKCHKENNNKKNYCDVQDSKYYNLYLKCISLKLLILYKPLKHIVRRPQKPSANT